MKGIVGSRENFPRFSVAMKSTHHWLLAFVLVLLLPRFAAAEDSYYNIPLSSLKFSEGSLPAESDYTWNRHWELMSTMQPYAVLDGAGEVYLTNPNVSWSMPGERSLNGGNIAIRAPDSLEIAGRLFVPQTNLTGMLQFKFKILPAESKPTAKREFFHAKEIYYRSLQERNIPGGAWFRYQADEAAKMRGSGTNTGPGMAMMNRFPTAHNSELENGYELFTGGRALSENLQLDRVLPMSGTNQNTVYLTNLTGITVKEMDWKGLIKDAKPDLDPLAGVIPADQHAIFFPSFQAMTLMIDEADANGTPVLQLLEPRAEDADCRTRYQKQLCVGLSEVSRLLGPQVIASVAFTGSDPYLRVGSDVAVLFEARNSELVKSFIAAQQKAAQSANPDAKTVGGDVAGVAYTGVVSPDRLISSYVASISNVVIVSNSRKQLENLVNVAKGTATALKTQDEYIFFRNRYARGDKSETAFIVLTDATIRRWCGAKWRIADSRRTRAAAVLSDLQAAHLGELVSGKVSGQPLSPRVNLSDAGEFQLTPAGVSSSTYGGLDFMTPIAELSLDKVSRAEADAYERWRESYQRNWRQYFDPIAIRFSITPGRLGAELTVMPLIAASDYREMIQFTSGASISPGSGDPHTNSLLHLVFSVNTQSKSVQDAGNFVGTVAPGLKANPFGWLGQSIAIYADEDSFWDRLKQSTNTETFLEHNFMDMPLALHFEVKNALGLAGFLTALHAFVDQSAPRMTTWQNLDYKDQPYVKVTSKSPISNEMTNELAVYYAATPRSLIVTLSEPLLKRALDRQATRLDAESKGQKIEVAVPWLGTNVCVVAERKFFDVLQLMLWDNYQSALQLNAWNNLPILNEWKRLYPDMDPVKVHEKVWGTRLLCPGGGTYVWNEKWKTMESTALGSPAEPKTSSSRALADVLKAQLGVSFENQGLSAKAVLNRSEKK
jgi:hypothetical protein